MIKINNKYSLSRLIALAAIFLVAQFAQAQCTFTVEKTGNTEDNGQVYILVDATTDLILDVVDNNPAGTNPSATFTTTSNGSFNVYAINYSLTDMPTPFPSIGDPIANVGMDGGCFSEFLNNFKPIECLCEGEDVTASYNVDAGYAVTYVLADNNGVIISSNTTGVFTTADGLVIGQNNIHALHYDTANPPDPIVGSAAGDLGVGDNISSVGTTSPGCFNVDFATLPLCVFLNTPLPAVIDPVGPLCASAAPIQLTATPAGGTFSGDGVDASGLFDPAVAGTGVHVITYSLGVAGTCAADGMLNISVTGGALIEGGTATSICGGAEIDLTSIGASISGGATDGTWSTAGDGVFDSTTFSTATTYTPGATDIANGSVILTLTATDTNGCISMDTLDISFKGIDCGNFPWDGTITEPGN